MTNHKPLSKPPGPAATRPTLRNLVARLGTIWMAAVIGMFALMAAGTSFSLIFGAIAAILLFIGLTGRGLGGMERSEAPAADGTTAVQPRWRRASSRFGLLAVIAVLFFLGVPGLLLVFVRSLVDPRFYGEGDFITRASQVIGLLVVIVVATHLWRRRRAGPEG